MLNNSAIKAERKERFNNAQKSNRYLVLKDAREKLRQEFISQGIISDPNKRTSLADAKPIIGTCTSMCPDFEREQREYQNNLDKHEVFPGTHRADPEKTVKTFHRSAAGNEEPLPTDLRTPETLLRTLDYLINVVITNNQTLESCHGFVRDRTRSIRQDFTLQNIRDSHTIVAHERIARFHIYAMHVLCGNKDFAEHQDMEQLRKVLKTLIELYDDHRKAGILCPNEAEFYAYYIVSHLRDSDAKRVAERLPKNIFLTPIIQQALKLHRLCQTSNEIVNRQQPPNLFAAQNFSTQFFRAVASDRTPPLLACLAEYEFPSIRRAGLNAMNIAFPHQNGKEYPIEDFASIFAFDSFDDVAHFCLLFNVPVNETGVLLGAKTGRQMLYREPENRPKRTKPNLRVVGAKLQNMTPMQAINSNLSHHFLDPSSYSNTRKAEIHKQHPVPPAIFSSSTPRTQPASSLPFTNVKPARSQDHNISTDKSPNTQKPIKTPDVPIFTQKQQSALTFANNRASIFTNNNVKEDFKPNKALSGNPSTVSSSNGGDMNNNNVTNTNGIASNTFSVKSIWPSPAAVTAKVEQLPTKSTSEIKETSTAFTSKPAEIAASLPSANPHTTFENPLALSKKPPAPIENLDTERPQVIWNKPRYRINRSSLANTLYENLVETLIGEVTDHFTMRVRSSIKIADELSNEISDSIVSYTSAFIAYEEAYRSVLMAKADHFRSQSVLSRVFSQWYMDMAVKQQEIALHKQYVDELDCIINDGYSEGSVNRNSNFNDDYPPLLGSDRVFMEPPRLQNRVYRQRYSERQDNKQQQINLDNFWESSNIGKRGFEFIRSGLSKYGHIPFNVSFRITGVTDKNSVLNSWLWWQIDQMFDDATSKHTESPRVVSYNNNNGDQLVSIKEGSPESSFAQPTLATGTEQAYSDADVIVLSTTPISSDMAKDLEHTPAGRDISNALNNVESMIQTGIPSAPRVFLLLYWFNGSESEFAVQSKVTQRTKGFPAHISSRIRICPIDINSPKAKLVEGFMWVFGCILRNRQLSLVTVDTALNYIKPIMNRHLQRTRDISPMLSHAINNKDAVTVFNLVVDIANAFIDVINRHVFKDAKSRIRRFTHILSESIDKSYFERCYFQSSDSSEAGYDVVFRATVLSIINNPASFDSDNVALENALVALSFIARHKIDEQQHTRSLGESCVDRHDFEASLEQANAASKKAFRQISRLCRDTERGDVSPMSICSTPKRMWDANLSELGTPVSINNLESPPHTNSALKHLAPSSHSGQSSTKRSRASSDRLYRLRSALDRANRYLN